MYLRDAGNRQYFLNLKRQVLTDEVSKCQKTCLSEASFQGFFWSKNTFRLYSIRDENDHLNLAINDGGGVSVSINIVNEMTVKNIVSAKTEDK